MGDLLFYIFILWVVMGVLGALTGKGRQRQGRRPAWPGPVAGSPPRLPRPQEPEPEPEPEPERPVARPQPVLVEAAAPEPAATPGPEPARSPAWEQRRFPEADQPQRAFPGVEREFPTPERAFPRAPAYTQTAASPSPLLQRLQQPSEAQQAVVMAEILGQPLSRRSRRQYGRLRTG